MMVDGMSRSAVLTDAQWELIEPLMPSSDGKRGNRFRDHRQVVEGVVYRFRTGIAWRDLPAEFGPWQTVWKRHRRFCGDGTWDRILTALLAHADAVGEIDWTRQRGLHDQPGPPARHQPDPSRAGHRGHCRITRICAIEPPDHAIGRSRGGLSHQDPPRCATARAARWCCCSDPGRASDSPMFPNLLDAIRVPALGPGRPRTRPDAVLADKAYSSRGNRALLRARGINAVIAEPSDQVGHRKRRGAKGGRPPAFDAEPTRAATSSSAPSTPSSSGAAWPPATTSSPSPTAAASSSAPSSPGYANWETRPSRRLPGAPLRRMAPGRAHRPELLHLTGSGGSASC